MNSRVFITFSVLLAVQIGTAAGNAGGMGGAAAKDDGIAPHNSATAEMRLRGLYAVQSGSLSTCLSGISGLQFATPASSAFAGATSVWNLRTLTTPVLVAWPKTTAQVALIVKCARRFGKKVVPRSGGHSYEGYSVQQGKITVDLSRHMTAVKLGSDGVASIGAGAKLGPVYKALWDQGRRTIPAGTCPTVGVGGHILGGGFGMLARKFGLASDRLVGLQMVTAAGEIVTADATRDADLLWASRGAGGGNLGIVTRFSVKTVKPPAQVTAIDITWPASATAGAIQWYQSKFPGLTADVSSDLFIGFGSVQLHALFLGRASAAQAVLAASNMGAVGRPLRARYDQMSYIDAVVHFGNQAEALQPKVPSSLSLGPGVQLSPPTRFKAKSNFITTPMSSAGVGLLAARIAAATQQGLGGWVQLHAYGAALNKVAPGDTAFVHRSTAASIQYYVSWSDPGQAQASTAWINGLWSALRPRVSASAYQNYIDKDLGASSLSAYYGANLKRLAEVKKKYDPRSFFGYPFSIPTAVAAG